MVELADGRIAPPANLDISTVQQQELAMSFRFHIRQYLSRRAADWQARGYTETLVDWPALNARSKYWGDDQRAAFKNWEEVTDPRNPLGGRQGVDERIMLRELLRRVDMMVMIENRLDALVRLHTPVPPGEDRRSERARAPRPPARGVAVRSERRPDRGAGSRGLRHDRLRSGFCVEPGPQALRAGASDTPTTIPAPGLPFSLVFRAEPGREDVVLKIASAYEAGSKRRVPPPAFGVLPSRGSGAKEN